MPDPGFITNPIPDTCKVIHARIEYEDIANIYPTDIAIAGGVKETIRALVSAVKGRVTKEKLGNIRAERLEKVNKSILEELRKIREKIAKKNWNSSPLSWERLSFEIDKVLEEDACIVAELDNRDPYYWINFGKGKKTLIGQTISSPNEIKPAMKRAIQATKDGRPYLIDAILAQRGSGAGNNWHPDISIASQRKKKV